jgi:hypothetical protein
MHVLHLQSLEQVTQNQPRERKRAELDRQLCDEIVLLLLCLFFRTKNVHLLCKSFSSSSSSSSSSSCRSLRSLKHGENGEGGDRLKLQNDNLVIFLTVAVVCR